MSGVPMIDLAGQHEPLAADLQRAAARVIVSNRFVLGAEVTSFERAVAALLGGAHAVGVSSGSDALLALLLAAGVGPGDDVITTPYSFFATSEAIVRAGARPVFADIDPETLNLDPEQAARRVGRATKALLPVHLFGRPARVAELATIAAQKGSALIEDAAQAIGAANVARYGGGAALSFFPTKNLGGFGDGGMVISNDDAVAGQVRALRAHGATAPHRHEAIGGNWRLDELQAALLAVKLPHLPAWTERRRRAAAVYRARLADMPVGLPPQDPGCVWNQFVIRVGAEVRSRLVQHLTRRSIACAIYYPRPLHLQPALSGLGHREGDFPHAERASRETLALPIYPELRDEDIDRVVDAVGSFFR
jgi:dTDP-4-amino-4,6-dideoxygalactose transaminase